MRLGFHGATSMTSDLETDVAATAHAGFQALEMWAGKIDKYLADHSLDELKALLTENGVAPMFINSIEFITFRGDEYPQIKARCRELCQLSQAIGSPTIIVVPSPTPSWETTWEEIVEEHVKVLRDLGDIAAEYGVKLSFELLGFGWCSVRTPHLDDLEDLPKETITDAKRLLPGLGVIPLADICQQLQKLGYNGDCSVELFRPEYWEWNPMELAVEVRGSAEKVLSPYFEVE